MKYGSLQPLSLVPVSRRLATDPDLSHHAHTLMCGDKLHLAPIEGDKVKVHFNIYPPVALALVLLVL